MYSDRLPQTSNEVAKKYNPLAFPLIMALLAAGMYFLAFHSERDKNEVLTAKLKTYETVKK